MRLNFIEKNIPLSDTLSPAKKAKNEEYEQDKNEVCKNNFESDQEMGDHTERFPVKLISVQCTKYNLNGNTKDKEMYSKSRRKP